MDRGTDTVTRGAGGSGARIISTSKDRFVRIWRPPQPGISLGFFLGLQMSQQLLPLKKEHENYTQDTNKVIIIGGGLAGLSCAITIIENGGNVDHVSQSA